MKVTFTIETDDSVSHKDIEQLCEHLADEVLLDAPIGIDWQVVDSKGNVVIDWAGCTLPETTD